MSRLIANESEISIYQNLSLGVDNQKQIKFWKWKSWLLFHGSLKALRYFYSPGIRAVGTAAAVAAMAAALFGLSVFLFTENPLKCFIL